MSSIGKVFVVAYACYFVVAINTASAIAEIDPLVLKAASMLGITGWHSLVQVVLPAALPRILTGLQVALAAAWVSVVAAEYVGASAGLGYLITNAQSGLETAKVLAGMIVIGAVGSLLSLAVTMARRVLVPYAAGRAGSRVAGSAALPGSTPASTSPGHVRCLRPEQDGLVRV